MKTKIMTGLLVTSIVTGATIPINTRNTNRSSGNSTERHGYFLFITKIRCAI